MVHRIIKSRSRNYPSHLSDCISSLFALELLSPSETVYLISPWISDMPLLDNRFGQFRAVLPSAKKGYIGLLDILQALAERGTSIRLICRPAQSETEEFLAQVHAYTEHRYSKALHEKGLLSSSFYLRGSMNFTYSGVVLNDETVELSTDSSLVSSALIETEELWNSIEYE